MNKSAKEQLPLLEEIQQVCHINLVTCGQCGDVFLHKIVEGDVLCPYCGYESDPGDFPDFFYPGWEESLKQVTKRRM